MLGISTFEFITQVLGPKDLKGDLGNDIMTTGNSCQQLGHQGKRLVLWCQRDQQHSDGTAGRTITR